MNVKTFKFIHRPMRLIIIPIQLLNLSLDSYLSNVFLNNYNHLLVSYLC